MPLYLTEAEVTELLTPADALAAVEGCFHRLAEGAVENVPRRRVRLERGRSRVMSAVDRELGLAGLKSYAWMEEGTPFVVVLFDTAKAELAAVIEADKLGPAAHRRGERCRGEVPGPRGRVLARGDRLRLAGAQPGRVHPRGAAATRAGRRLLP